VYQAGTLSGGRVVTAAALATLDVIDEEQLVENAERRGRHAIDRLRALAERFDIIGDVRDHERLAHAMEKVDFVLNEAHNASANPGNA